MRFLSSHGHPISQRARGPTRPLSLVIAAVFLVLGLCVLEPANAEAAAAVESSPGQYPEKSFEQSFEQSLAGLAGRSFKVKAAAAEAIAASGDERAADVLDALLNGQLFYRKADKLVVYAEKQADGYRISDALSGDSLGDVAKGDVKKISVNNKMRRQLRAAIAGLSLGHPDPQVRLGAVQEVMDKLDEGTVAAASCPSGAGAGCPGARRARACNCPGGPREP